MGTSPPTSVVNKYLQSWDVPNVFVMGASAFPQNMGYNPTGIVAALDVSTMSPVYTQGQDGVSSRHTERQHSCFIYHWPAVKLKWEARSVPHVKHLARRADISASLWLAITHRS